MKRSTWEWVGTFFAIALAGAVSAVVPGGLHDLSQVDWQGWRVVEPAVVALAWLGLLAWVWRRWALAAVCFTVTLVAPWGFFIFGPLIALALAGVSAAKAVRGRAARRMRVVLR